ncbi:hypothetical protein K523DRAFT_61753 [Schizophyllum commune Tattone D]|nr:hypothetical protein K523DRAFT_61753 [Schizophyllum commune Tattone D]
MPHRLECRCYGAVALRPLDSYYDATDLQESQAVSVQVEGVGTSFVLYFEVDDLLATAGQYASLVRCFSPAKRSCAMVYLSRTGTNMRPISRSPRGSYAYIIFASMSQMRRSVGEWRGPGNERSRASRRWAPKGRRRGT